MPLTTKAVWLRRKNRELYVGCHLTQVLSGYVNLGKMLNSEHRVLLLVLFDEGVGVDGGRPYLTDLFRTVIFLREEQKGCA